MTSAPDVDRLLVRGAPFCGCQRSARATAATPLWTVPWPSPIRWSVREAPPNVTLENYRLAINEAFAKWRRYIAVEFMEVPLTAPHVIEFRVGGSDTGMGPGVMAASVIPDGYVRVSYLWLNREVWWGYPSVGMSHILCHELGHCIGWLSLNGQEHSHVEGALMGGMYNETQAPQQHDDVEGILQMYPPPPATAHEARIEINGPYQLYVDGVKR